MTTLIPKFQQTGTGAVNRAFDLKFKDYVSVTDFGAIGDGTTDNTTAINNASAYCVTTGKKLYIPAGYYLVSGQLLLGGDIFGDKGTPIATDFYGSTQYNTNSNFGLGTVIVWDKSTLTTSSVHIIPTSSSTNTVLNIESITFASKSSGSNGGGYLIQFRDGTNADSFTGGHKIRDCNIINFARGYVLDRVSGFDSDRLIFNGCQNAIWSGDTSGGAGVVTDVIISNAYFQGCGYSDGSGPCIELQNVFNFAFRDCTIQGTSYINLFKIYGTLTFDHCWIEAQSTHGNYWLKAQVGGIIQTIVLQNCYAGAGTIGKIDLSANVTGGNLNNINSKMAGMDIVLDTAQTLLNFGGTDQGTVTGGTTSIIAAGGFYWRFGSVNFHQVQPESNATYTLGSSTQAWLGLYVSPILVASLPAAATAGAGAKFFVSDATATTFASTVAGGGANKVPVYSDGTNWKIG